MMNFKPFMPLVHMQRVRVAIDFVAFGFHYQAGGSPGQQRKPNAQPQINQGFDRLSPNGRKAQPQ